MKNLDSDTLWDKEYENLLAGKNADGSDGWISYELPVTNSKWKHHNGLEYKVLLIANEGSTNPEYPQTVVYCGMNGKVWAKSLSNFLTKMEKL